MGSFMLAAMTHFAAAFLIFSVSTIFLVACKDTTSNDAKDENKIDHLEKILLRLQKEVEEKHEFFERKIQFLEANNKAMVKNNEILEEENQILKERNQNLEKKTKSLEEKNKGIEDDIKYLMELSKLNVGRTCEEMAMYGVDKTGFFFVDPDGLGGEVPIMVYCQFGQSGVALTMISHDTEGRTQVSHCKDPGCYSRKVKYNAPMKQIESLIQWSESCTQDIGFECFMSGLQIQGIDYGFWLDRNGESQIYWTGSHHGQHVCSCHYNDEGCFDEENLQNSCNCDALEPSEMSDIGTVTNSTALPITELRFGGLESDVQSAVHTLGKLTCSGMKSIDPDVPNTIFSAYKTHGQYGKGKYIISYDKFLLNYGNAFDLDTGTFTAQRPGIFEFFVSMYHLTSGHALLGVMKNGILEVNFDSYDDYYDSLSFSWIMELQEGDIVQLKVISGVFRCYDIAGCIFNGKFIQEI